MYRLAENLSEVTIIKGVAYYSATLYEEGLEAIKRAISLNPNDIQSHELYLYYLGADNSIESSQLILEEVSIILELDPEHSTARYYKEAAWADLEGFQTATARANATNTPPPRPIPPESTEPNIPTPTRKLVQDSLPTKTPTQLVAPEAAQEESPTESPNNVLVIILVPTLIILLLLGGIAAIRAMNRK